MDSRERASDRIVQAEPAIFHVDATSSNITVEDGPSVIIIEDADVGDDIQIRSVDTATIDSISGGRVPVVLASKVSSSSSHGSIPSSPSIHPSSMPAAGSSSAALAAAAVMTEPRNDSSTHSINENDNHTINNRVDADALERVGGDAIIAAEGASRGTCSRAQ